MIKLSPGQEHTHRRTYCSSRSLSPSLGDASPRATAWRDWYAFWHVTRGGGAALPVATRRNMLIARCISALTDGPANQRGRSPHSDSLAARVAPPSLTPPGLRHQQHHTHTYLLTYLSRYSFRPQEFHSSDPVEAELQVMSGEGKIQRGETTWFLWMVFFWGFSCDTRFL